MKKKEIMEKTGKILSKICFSNIVKTLILISVYNPCNIYAGDLTDKEPQYRKEIYEITYAHIPARALHIAAYYKIFDLIDEKPMSAEEIAQKISFNSANVKALMMVLANHDLIVMDQHEKFFLNEKSKLLVSNTQGSLQPSVAKEYDIKRWGSMGRVDLAVIDGKKPFDTLYQESFYDYLRKDKKAAELFNLGMANFSMKEDQEIPHLYNFGQFNAICDVGGSNGSLMNQMLTKYNHLNGTVLDLKDAIEDSFLLKNHNFGSRLKGVAGDFFHSVPKADAFIVKRVVHNWDFNHAVKILKNCVASLNDSKNGRIFIIEKVMPKTPDKSLLVDASLLGIALGGAPERNLEEYKSLADAAGLELVEKFDTKGAGVSMLVFKAKD